MQRKTLWIVAPLVLAGLVIAGVVLAPGVLSPRSTVRDDSRNASPEPSPSPQPAETISVPTWHVGDSWTYNVSFGRPMDEGGLGPSGFHGEITKSVAAVESTGNGEAYNVTVDGAFAFEGFTALTESGEVHLSDANVGGYTRYRTSDLAKILEARTLQISGSVSAFNRTLDVSYSSTVTVSFDPPLAVWQFPLAENATWNVTSNATIHYAASYELVGTNLSFGTTHWANLTLPVRFAVRTGMFEDVTTPAGTFRALEASAYPAPIRFAPPERAASLLLNTTEEPILAPPHPFARAWFSGNVGNVVKAVSWGSYDLGGRLEIVLVAYHRD